MLYSWASRLEKSTWGRQPERGNAMSREKAVVRTSEVWGQFRLSVVGRLLHRELEEGELSAELESLAEMTWTHPITGMPKRFGSSTLERWYYQARSAKVDVVGALKRKLRSDAGSHPSIHESVGRALRVLRAENPAWNYQLVFDNLQVLAERDTALQPLPSYESVVRYMREAGLLRRARRGPLKSPGGERAEARYARREVRGYECDCVNGLWHLDFHHGSLPVLLRQGEWSRPLMLCMLDDHSRLVCHCQWYLAEDAQTLIHGLQQGFAKRGLPRSIMWDNGAAMRAQETISGMARLSIEVANTLPYSPYQNGKQESFWAQVESRLLAMLANVPDLTLSHLNRASQAWVEMEYNRKEHSEIKVRPVDRVQSGKHVGRPAPPSAELQQCFTREVRRTQRRSDGTITVSGVRCEIPSAYAHIQNIHVRYAEWDLTHIWLCDTNSGALLQRIYPQNKTAHADGLRRTRAATDEAACTTQRPQGLTPTEAAAPLMHKLMAEYAATGLPPAYLPTDFTRAEA